MHIKINITGLERLQRQLTQVSERRWNAVMATTLTRTARRMSVLWQEDIDATIDRPMARTKKAVRIESAKANKLSALVALKDMGGSGMAPAEYLQQHEWGGSRLVKKFERALIASGAMPSGYITVPGRGVKLNTYGNVSRSVIIAVLRQLASSYSAGYQQTISRDADKRAKANARHGKRYFVMPVGHPTVSPGIYVRGRGRSIQALFLFKRIVNYSRRLTLQAAARQQVPVIANEEFHRALSESLARMG